MRTPHPDTARSKFRVTPIMAALALAFGPHLSAHAVTFIVTNSGDNGGVNPAPGAATGTLRQAIVDANQGCAGGDTIATSGGPFTINVAAPLPTLLCATTVDGGGSTIDGTAPSSASQFGCGFTATAGTGAVIKGFEIRNFTYGGSGGICGSFTALGNKLHDNSFGIHANTGTSLIGDASLIGRNFIFSNGKGVLVDYGGTVSITNNYIGTPDGTTGAGNGTGIAIGGSNSAIVNNVISASTNEGILLQLDNGTAVTGNTIGLDATAGAAMGNQVGVSVGYSSGGPTFDGNYISGNRGAGVVVNGGNGGSISDNRIGTDRFGNVAIPNGSDGVQATCLNGVTWQDNVISANLGSGVVLSGSGNRFNINHVGTSTGGTGALGNNAHGILVQGTCATNGNNVMNGNTVGNNGGDGISIRSGTGNTITLGSYFNNGKNIDLNGNAGQLGNDGGDGDTGPNNQQNWPHIDSVVQSGGSTTVAFTLDTVPGVAAPAVYRIEFFENPAAGGPAGKTFVDFTSLTAAAGPTSGTFTLAGLRDHIAATATSPGGDTSELSLVVSTLPTAAVSLSANFLGFTSTVGSPSAPQTITLRSSGSAPYRITTFDSSPLCYGGPICASGDFTCSTTCATNTDYPLNATCTFTASFNARFTGGSSDSIYICDNAPTTNPERIDLNGFAAVPPPLEIAPSSFDFGRVLVGRQSAPVSFSIINHASVSADISAPSTTGDFVLTSTNCGPTLASLTSCDANVAFAPSQGTPAVGTLQLFINGSTSAPSSLHRKFTLNPLVKSDLSGTGFDAAQLVLPPGVDLGTFTLGSAAPLATTITLTNTGNAVLTFSSVTVSGPFTLINNCPLNLSPGQSCDLRIEFRPTAAGTFTGNVAVVTNASGGSGSIGLVARSQLIAAPVIKVSPISIGFGNQLIDTASADQKVTITNEGGAIAALTGLSVSPDFVITSTTCGLTLASQATCFANVAMQPMGFGQRDGKLLVNSNAAGSPAVVNLVGTGCRPFSVGGNRVGGGFNCSP